MQDTQIANGYIQLWASYLKQQGIDPLQADFLSDLRPVLTPLIGQPFDAEVPLELLNDVLGRTIEYLKRPQLIFEIAHVIQPAHFGVLGYLASKSGSLAEIIHYIMRFQRLIVDGYEFVPVQLKQQPDHIELYWTFIHDKYTLLNELTMAAMVQLGREIFQQQSLKLQAVHFVHSHQAALHHYQKFYASKVLFQQAVYALHIDIRELNLTLDQSDPMLLQLLEHQAEEKIAAKHQPENILQRMQQLIAEGLRTEQRAMKIEQLAAQLYISVRSLQRECAQHGTSFKQILETERMKRCELLLQQGLSLSQIAEQLDYSDQSALARAYKAATGQTLRARRKALKQQ